jgi:hypothetical protein
VKYREPVLNVELHTFGDASTKGVGAVVYSVVRQKFGNTQQLVTAKSRLAKEGLTIPRWFNQKTHTEPLNLQIRQASPQIRRKWP